MQPNKSEDIRANYLKWWDGHIRETGQIHDRFLKLRKAGLNLEEKAQPQAADLPQTFAGQTWCVTGSFARFSPREKAMEEVTRRGGKAVDSVTSKTTHLLVGGSPGSKLQKAQKLGVTLVNEEEFLALLRQS